MLAVPLQGGQPLSPPVLASRVAGTRVTCRLEVERFAAPIASARRACESPLCENPQGPSLSRLFKCTKFGGMSTRGEALRAFIMVRLTSPYFRNVPFTDRK